MMWRTLFRFLLASVAGRSMYGDQHAGTATITFDGATYCDGCSIVTLPDGSTGSLCETPVEE